LQHPIWRLDLPVGARELAARRRLYWTRT
jgi:hypothetical protein